ncbi:MAG: PAS domain S-box protein, partial [Ignavibacteria bacterium]
ERFAKIKEIGSYIYESTHKRKDGSLFDVEVNASPFELDGELYFIGSVRDISERKKSFIELQTKLNTEIFLTEIASEMVNLTFNDLDEKISNILRRIGEFVKIDRIRIFLKDLSLPFYNCKYEWCRLGIEPYKESLQFLDLPKDFPFLYSVIKSGKIFKCKDVEALPIQADKEKSELKKQSIRSFLWKPIWYKGELTGFISLSTVGQMKDFSIEDELIINIFSELFINSYQRILYETQILESEKRFKKLVESSSDVILIISKDFRNMYISPSVTNVLGYLVEERLNQNPLSLVHPDDLYIVQEAIEKIKNPEDKITIQFRAKHKLGHYLYLEATLTNLYDDPLINGMVVNYHDITETREAYLKLQESEERYKILAEETGDVLYRLDYSTMKYEFLSPVIKKLTGYTPEEINDIGFNNIVEEIFLILNPDTTKEQIINKRLKGETGEYLADYRIRTKTGDLKWVRDHSFPFFDSDGKLVGSIGILSDTTELKKQEEEIKRREDYLNVLVDIQKSLIFLEDLKKFYNYMLPKLGKVSNASRCYVFENSKDESGK